MKSVENILFDLCGEGVKLWVEGDLLRYKAPHGKLTPALKTEIADRKAEIIAFLRDAKSSGSSRSKPSFVLCPTKTMVYQSIGAG
jgi:hypothetical protein